MNLSAIHKCGILPFRMNAVVCDIGGYEFVSYSQEARVVDGVKSVVCDIGGYEFVSYSQGLEGVGLAVSVVCDIGGYEFVSYSQVPDCLQVVRVCCL